MDWDATRYHRLSDPQLAWGRRVLARLAPVDGERILDLGCGTGRLTQELLQMIGRGHVVGLDRSSAMLKEAVSRSAANPPVAALHEVPTHSNPFVQHRDEDARRGPRISFVQADGAALPFVDSLDAIFSTATLHWILDHDQAFASMYRALAPGGRVVAQCGGGPNLRSLLVRTHELMRQPRYAIHFDGFNDPWEFADILNTTARLERAGFTSIVVSLEEAPTTLPDRDTYADFLSTVCIRHHIDRLPESERPDFVGALADQAASDSPAFTLDYCRLNFSARKPTGAEQAA
jgi:trans-aconitate 2-methyltransferase